MSSVYFSVEIIREHSTKYAVLQQFIHTTNNRLRYKPQILRYLTHLESTCQRLNQQIKFAYICQNIIHITAASFT